jgi:replicative DNA helicase
MNEPELQTATSVTAPIYIKPISVVADESAKYIKARKTHEIVALRSRWNKFNKATGGIEPNMVFTIAGISGSGKSSFVNTLAFDLIDCNPNQEIVILNFSFEMVGYRNIGRTISNKLRKTTSELYSAAEDLSDDDYAKVLTTVNSIKKYPIYYVDTPCSVAKMEETITYFHDTVAKGKWLIVILDHTLLVEGDTERGTLVDLQKMFIRVKKLSFTTIIQLSQMNRNIEQPERLNNPSSHYPIRSDLSASDAIFHASDFVIVMNRPEMLNLAIYGVQRLPVKDRVYLHFLKVRDGEPCILEFKNDLRYNNLIETTIQPEANNNLSSNLKNKAEL